MLAIALITGSCSNDLDEVPAPAAGSSGQAITFKPWANKPLRAAATQAKDVTDFAVLATDTTLSTGVGVLINGVLVVGSNATSWTYSPPAFWPETAAVNFFAFSPTAALGVTNGVAALAGQNDATAGQPNITYELPTTLTDQKDLLVARRSSTFSQDGAGGVLLNFRHALSRVLFQAKSESSMQFIVSSIKLKNVKSKATLDLNYVPKDTDPFPYPTDNATIASPGYQTHWVPDGASTVELTANITDTVVAGDGAWHYVVGDVDALYVIPQENDPSDLNRATLVASGDPDPSGGFYIEITYRENGAGAVNRTYAVPVPAIVGDAYASSIAFEMERQYTFQFELFGKKPIEFKGVTVSDYSTVEQEEPLRLHWAGSNIYWDGTKLTFADSDDKSKEQYQGVFFKWGSLVGMSPAGANGSAWSRVTYFPTNPGVDETWTTDDITYANYADIPYATGTLTSYLRDSTYLTAITNDLLTGKDTIAARKGDICVYLTKIGAAPKGKRWRMPTNKEFEASGDYAKVGASGATTGNANGTAPIPSGWRRQNLNTPYFPASGLRENLTGVLTNVGIQLIYWSSSSFSATNGYSFSATSTAVYPIYNSSNYRPYGFPVRCVSE
ncbi:hypothetical protein AGMMS50239_08450 [Bacteroidia bacterium]|nr:hypothetical protein AGMMS50239_08450 [Bacteroidia bacterium]